MFSLNADIIKNSLISTGNTARFIELFKKAANGEPVIVAAIGGSITEGLNAKADTCYAALFVDWMRKKYNNPNIMLINAGESGTTSKLGVMRAGFQVLDYKPDIIIVEFAVNDGNDSDSNIAYESLVRKILNSSSKPAVCLLFAVLKDGGSNQSNMERIGEHYELPMVSVKNSVFAEIEAKRMIWENYSDDKSHPHVQGHKYISEMLAHCFEVLEKQESSVYIVPETAIFGNKYEDFIFLNKNNYEPDEVGGFTEDASDIKKILHGGWKRPANGSNEPFIFSLRAKEAYLIYWETPGYGQPSGGKIEIYINSKMTKVIDADKNWGNPQFTQLFNGEDATGYILELKPFENKPFWIIGIGVIK